MHLIQSLREEHRQLPWPLRVWFLVPTVAALVIFMGMVFTLPPGPLCDEGMVLFMEGGCDWGNTNIFFFSKLGLLIGINAAFVVSCRSGVRSIRAFLPHLLVLSVLSICFFSDTRCDTYYSHPNGSIGQMTVEAAAFAVLGISLVRFLAKHSSWLMTLLIMALWNILHIALFYVGLIFTNHWTWLHTVWLAGTMLLFALLCRLTLRSTGRTLGLATRSPIGMRR